MLLKEMFSPIGAPDEDDLEINWLEDLKFFISNSNEMLELHLFPAVKKHKKHLGHPRAFKLYIQPINNCLDAYCKEYDIQNREEIFPQDAIVDLAKHFAELQEKFIERGDYK